MNDNELRLARIERDMSTIISMLNAIAANVIDPDAMRDLLAERDHVDLPSNVLQFPGVA